MSFSSKEKFDDSNRPKSICFGICCTLVNLAAFLCEHSNVANFLEEDILVDFILIELDSPMDYYGVHKDLPVSSEESGKMYLFFIRKCR